MKLRNHAAIALACALVACGGGGGNSGVNKTQVTTLKVAGASLADSGALGYKFTVQPSSTYPLVYTERIAATYGTSQLCSAYLGRATQNNAAADANCSNFAVAGASVNNYNMDADAALPTFAQSGVKQLADMAAASDFTSGDLVLVGEFAANDVATLVTAYSALSAGGTDFRTMLLTLLPQATVDGLIGTAQGRASLGVLYMQKIADKLRDAINTSLIANGATRIAVLNCLDVTLTPKLQAALAQLRLGEANDPTNYPAGTANNFQAMVRAWVQAFNTQLDANMAPYGSKVAVVDFYTNFVAEMADPTQYGLTDVTYTVCDEIVNSGSTTSIATAGSTSLSTVVSGVPTVAAACTSTAASALTPQHSAVNGTNWWKTYLFADNFHPTPYGHQLLAQLVAKRLTEAGWL